MTEPRTFPEPPADDAAIYALMWQRHTLPVVALARELGVLDHLAEAPLGIDDLAGFLRVEPRAAEAMLAVCAAAGFLVRDEQGRYGVGAEVETYLLETSPYPYPPLMVDDDPALTRLRRVFAGGGEPVDPIAVAMTGQSDATVTEFMDRMHRYTLPAATGLARQPVFATLHRLLDVAGGSGSLSCVLAERHPHLQCTVFDLPPVAAIARGHIADYGLSERVEAVAGDMFEGPWPDGHDAVLFGNIFHDWDVPSCEALARRAFEALPPGGTVLLHEMLLDETKDGPLGVACFSVSMLIHEKGKQYTLGELTAVLEGAGFEGVEAQPSFGWYSLVSATRPAEG